MLLKTLEGAAFGAKLKEIAGRKEFHALLDISRTISNQTIRLLRY